jgi:hypothetical protein
MEILTLTVEVLAAVEIIHVVLVQVTQAVTHQ